MSETSLEYTSRFNFNEVFYTEELFDIVHANIKLLLSDENLMKDGLFKINIRTIKEDVDKNYIKLKLGYYSQYVSNRAIGYEFAYMLKRIQELLQCRVSPYLFIDWTNDEKIKIFMKITKEQFEQGIRLYKLDEFERLFYVKDSEFKLTLQMSKFKKLFENNKKYKVEFDNRDNWIMLRRK